MTTQTGKPLSPEEVKQVCFAELSDARTFTSEIQQDRQDALKAYQQDKYGDEQEGQSSYVASDVRDTIEAILPDIVEIFVAGDHPVEFEPVDEADIDAADDETEAVRHVFLNQNDGFVNVYTAVKDALLSKNPYWYVGYETDYRYSREEYWGLSPEQFTLLMQDQDVEVVAHTPNQEVVQGQMGQVVMESHDVLVRRKRGVGKVCVYPLPPERVHVSRFHSAVDTTDARCVVYEELAMAGDLIEQGIDPAIVEDIPSYQWFSRREELTRWRKEGGFVSRDNPGLDSSRRIVQILNFYIRVDEDGDGIPELRHIRFGSENAKVLLSDEEIDRIPIVSGAVIMNPHKHYGNSLADLLQDIQKIRTAITRQALNNTYFNNYPVTFINENAASENTYQDLLSRRPAGFVRANDIMGIRTEPPQLTGQQSLAMLDMVDVVKSDRVGFSRETQGVDPNALSDATNLVGMTMLSRSQNRIKMMARVFAETGFKNLMLAIHELLMKHGDSFPIRRKDSFKMINPRDWKRRERMTVKVGTGYSNRMEKISSAEAVLAKQQLVVQAGGLGRLVSEKTLYNAIADWCKASGCHVSKYFTDPSTMPPPPHPQPDAQMLAVQVANKESDVSAMKTASDTKLEWAKHQDDVQIKREQIASNHYLKARELELKYGRNVNEHPSGENEEPAENAGEVESTEQQATA